MKQAHKKRSPRATANSPPVLPANEPIFPTCSHIHSLLLSHFIQEVAKNSLCIAILSQNNALSYAIVPIEQIGITPKNEEIHIARIKPNVALNRYKWIQTKGQTSKLIFEWILVYNLPIGSKIIYY